MGSKGRFVANFMVCPLVREHRRVVCHTESVITGLYSYIADRFPERNDQTRPSSRCSGGRSSFRFASAATRRLRGLAMAPPALLTGGLRPAGCCLFGGEGWACTHSSCLLGSGPRSCRGARLPNMGGRQRRLPGRLATASTTAAAGARSSKRLQGQSRRESFPALW